MVTSMALVSDQRKSMFLTLTTLQCIAGQCIIVPQVYYGAGRHFEYIEPEHFKSSFKLNFITQPLYLLAICLTKISVGFFLLRIAVRPFYRRLIISIMGECEYARNITIAH
jgi:hypothetical protein